FAFKIGLRAKTALGPSWWEQANDVRTLKSLSLRLFSLAESICTLVQTFHADVGYAAGEF
ncbi:MAG: hypothetical protein WCH39_27790, partial [Schlesneria sp.]